MAGGEKSGGRDHQAGPGHCGHSRSASKADDHQLSSARPFDHAIGARECRAPKLDVPFGCDIVGFMTKPKLIYFDAPVSRGEECRLALHLADVDFEDVRISAAAWAAMKEQTPYGGLPSLELPGRLPLAHSNAILVMIGRQHGLHPSDDFEAARHEGMMQHVEDLRSVVGPTIRMGDAEKKAAREAIVADFLPAWARAAEKNILGEPFFSGIRLHVADLKLHMAVRWFIGGKVDHIPAAIFASYPKLMRVHDAVRDHAGVRSWYAKA
jgi:glutathione S-transferase